MQLQISITWGVGLALAVARSGAMVASCGFVPRSIPGGGRTALAIALGILVSQPIASPDISTADLAVAAFTNVTVGAVLGWFLGLALAVFQVAGTAVDLTSGVSLGSVFDPDAGTTPGAFAHFYNLGAQTLIIAAGGLLVIANLLWLSTKAIALDGHLGNLGPLGAAATDRVDSVFRHGVELALPIIAVLFVAELTFGLLSRLAPQINMFLIALPVKSLMAISLLGTASALFPRFANQSVRDGVDATIRLLGG
ncbi:MAG: flagellar biosynthetic protein FliR [Actinobacteria bacterium]|nr:flagellar biosynthetic protein FliR [Actinomycetota bacterium]